MSLITICQLSVSHIDQLGFASDHCRQLSAVEAVTANPYYRGTLGFGPESRRTSRKRYSSPAFITTACNLRRPTPRREHCVIYRECRGGTFCRKGSSGGHRN